MDKKGTIITLKGPSMTEGPLYSCCVALRFNERIEHIVQLHAVSCWSIQHPMSC